MDSKTKRKKLSEAGKKKKRKSDRSTATWKREMKTETLQPTCQNKAFLETYQETCPAILSKRQHSQTLTVHTEESHSPSGTS